MGTVQLARRDPIRIEDSGDSRINVVFVRPGARKIELLSQFLGTNVAMTWA